LRNLWSTRCQAIVGYARTSERLSASFRRSAFALAMTVLLALLGWPASNGGCGSYST
jgi:hypothetical protein